MLELVVDFVAVIVLAAVAVVVDVAAAVVVVVAVETVALELPASKSSTMMKLTELCLNKIKNFVTMYIFPRLDFFFLTSSSVTYLKFQ